MSVLKQTRLKVGTWSKAGFNNVSITTKSVDVEAKTDCFLRVSWMSVPMIQTLVFTCLAQMSETTKSTFDEFCQGIPLNKFPQTFKDAIVVCQKLQIRYLWIDSLCIIQDDEDDWAVQSPKMSDVYQNAYITIAAAAARNSTEGCFRQRPFSVRKSLAVVAEVEDKVEQVEVFARPWQSSGHWTKNIGDGPLYLAQNPLETRAWTLQEHILSGRILRFTAHEMVWHCREVHLCECRPGCALHKEALRLVNLDRMTNDKESSFGVRASDPRIVWSEVVGPFTRRAITHESDRLPAISGVAAALAGPMGMEYIGGMWKGMLGNTVCWSVENPGASRRETYYAPTWSWASVVGPVEAVWTASTMVLPQTEIIDVQYTLATPNPYGRLSAATLTIKGLLLDVSITSSDDLQEDGSYNISFQMQFLKNSVTDTDMKLEIISPAFPDIDDPVNTEETAEANYGRDNDHLVISDFGLTEFKSFTSKSHVTPSKIQGYSGTYKPPGLDFGKVNQRYDIWSLGCVFLELASWLLLGGDAVTTLREQRLMRDPRFQADLTVDKSFYLKTMEDSSLLPKVKPCVLDWIQSLHALDTCPKSVHDFLEIIQEKMLQPKAAERSRSNEIRGDLYTIYHRCIRDEMYATKGEAIVVPRRSAAPTRQQLPQTYDRSQQVIYPKLTEDMRHDASQGRQQGPQAKLNDVDGEPTPLMDLGLGGEASPAEPAHPISQKLQRLEAIINVNTKN
ncbi:hypothetical protein CEP51_000446 [Fusarium floridanum]|uniref:Heterokaryon incompatibility domain-containing protein n=1 Tax=Fusarium floridanum TaxID=1325733 RepID=A0A428SMG1_9HYPO|nr:hypothetical protein CEP51_000446 [Fusarium floridanum]